MRTLYYNCPAGISGDMNLAAMVGLGIDPDRLRAELAKLGLENWTLSFEPADRQGIHGLRCEVRFEESHHHRTFATIRELIEKSSLVPEVRRDAIAVFRCLAEAEGRVHGIAADKVHFHEVGALDSLLDIVGAAICWHWLGVDRLAASTLELGSGTVTCAHGKMPVPAPATARLVESLPVRMGGTTGEATTPTGAALLVGKQCSFGSVVEGRTVASGVGLGAREDPRIANALHVTLLESGPSSRSTDCDRVIELATNLDDLSPELIGYLVELLMSSGALDVWQVPATFKKGRLGCVLSVLIRPDQQAEMTDLIFRHSTTLGIRWREWERSLLERISTERATPLGTVRVKTATWRGETIRSKVEYEDLRRLARDHHLSLSEVQKRIES